MQEKHKYMCLMHDDHQFNVLDNIRHAHAHANAIKLYGQLHYVMYVIYANFL